MVAEIIARFADGRLLVQEDRTVATNYTSGPVQVRIGFLQKVEKVLSIDNYMSGYPGDKVMTHIKDVAVSGDSLWVTLRRDDLGVATLTGKFSGLAASGVLASGAGALGFSGFEYSGIVTLDGPVLSGNAALGVLSAITSGIGRYEELTSGRPISGVLHVLANVIGY